MEVLNRLNVDVGQELAINVIFYFEEIEEAAHKLTTNPLNLKSKDFIYTLSFDILQYGSRISISNRKTLFDSCYWG